MSVELGQHSRIPPGFEASLVAMSLPPTPSQGSGGAYAACPIGSRTQAVDAACPSSWERQQIAIPGRHAKDAENRRIPFDPQGRLAPSLKRQSADREVARPAGFEPAPPGLEGRSYRPIRDGPRQFLLILQGFLKVGGNCLPPQTVTECHTSVTPQPF